MRDDDPEQRVLMCRNTNTNNNTNNNNGSSLSFSDDETQPLLSLQKTKKTTQKKHRFEDHVMSTGKTKKVFFVAAVFCVVVFVGAMLVGTKRRQFLFREGVGKESSSSSTIIVDAAAADLDDAKDASSSKDAMTTTTQTTPSREEDDEDVEKNSDTKRVEPELAFHTEDEIASVIAAVVEGDEKKTNEREEEKKRRRRNNAMKTSSSSPEKETTTTTTTTREEPSRMGMTEQYDALDRDERSNDALTRGESTKERVSMDAATSTSDAEEDKDDQEDEAEEQSQAEEKSRAWELSTYLNVQPESEKSAESLVALIASAGGDERELEKYVKVVEPIDPSQWPVNIDKAMYALKSIFRLKSREMEESQLEAKLGDLFDDEMEDGIATRNRRSLKSEPAEEGGKLGYFDMGKFIEDAMNGRVREKTNEDDDDDDDEKNEKNDDDDDYDSIIETSRSKVASLGKADDNKASLDNQAVGALGYFDFKDFVKDVVSVHSAMTEDDDNEEHASNLASVGIQLGEGRREETPRLGKSIEEPSKSNESLKELGLTADDVKFLYKAYKKEKKEKENLEDNLERFNKSTVEDDNEDDEAMTSAKAWNLNHLRGMGWFEALIDRDKETGKLSSKWWQTEKIPELGKLFSHVYRWQLAKDAKDEKALILDAAGLLDTSNLAVPMDAIRVISAHASNDFDVMFLSNLGTKDPIFETFPDSSGNVIEIRKWQGTQDATNANAYIVSAQFVNKIFDFILSSEMNAPKESLENWLGRVVCGAKEQQPQQDDSGGTSSDSLESNVDESLSEESTLAKKPVVGKHVFNCYSATGVQVKPTTSNASSKQDRRSTADAANSAGFDAGAKNGDAVGIFKEKG